MHEQLFYHKRDVDTEKRESFTTGAVIGFMMGGLTFLIGFLAISTYFFGDAH